MAIKECRKCGKQYNNANRKSCPKCNSKKHIEEALQKEKGGKKKKSSVEVLVNIPPTDMEILPEERVVVPQRRESNSTNVAIDSAKLVNGYGKFLQIVGMIAGLAIIIGGFVVAKSNGNAAYGVGGVIIGVLDMAMFTVQGALYRMLSNYVIAKLDKTKVS